MDIGSPHCCCGNYYPFLYYETVSRAHWDRLARIPALYTVDCPTGRIDTISDSTEDVHWVELEDMTQLSPQDLSLGLRDEGVAYAWHIVVDSDPEQSIILADWSQFPDGLPGAAAVIAHRQLTEESDPAAGIHFPEAGIVGTQKRRKRQVVNALLAGSTYQLGWGCMDNSTTIFALSADSEKIFSYELRPKTWNSSGTAQPGCNIKKWERSGSSITYHPQAKPSGGEIYLSFGASIPEYADPVITDGDDGYAYQFTLDDYTDDASSCVDGVPFGLRTLISIPPPAAIALRDPERCIGVQTTRNGIVDIGAGSLTERMNYPQDCVWNYGSGKGELEHDYKHKIALVSGKVGIRADPYPGNDDQLVYVQGEGGSPPVELWSHESSVLGRAYDQITIRNGIYVYQYDGHSSGDSAAFTALKHQGLTSPLSYGPPYTANQVNDCKECDDGSLEGVPVGLAYPAHDGAAGDFVEKYDLANVVMIDGTASEELLFSVVHDRYTGEVTWTEHSGKFSGGFGMVDGVGGTPFDLLSCADDEKDIDPDIFCPAIHCCADGSVASVQWDEWKKCESKPDSSTAYQLETVKWKFHLTGGATSPATERVCVKQQAHGATFWGRTRGSYYGLAWESDNWRPFISWSSDRWLYLYNFPITDLQLDSKLSSEVVMEDIDYGFSKSDLDEALPEWVRPAHSTLEVYDEESRYFFGDRVWYPDAETGEEFTCKVDDTGGSGAGAFDVTEWDQEDGTGWVWLQWMVSPDGQIWIPSGCRDSSNRPNKSHFPFNGTGNNWAADALCKSRGENEVPLIPPAQDHGRRRLGQPS